jgi:hypothetical protein
MQLSLEEKKGYQMNNKGVESCEKAFERLVESEPHVACHVGLPKHKITAGIVSVEAGFNRGYLKKARPTHMALIARINNYRTENINVKSCLSRTEEVSRAKKRVKILVETEKAAQERSYKLIEKNLILIERIRELEELVSNYQSVHKF